MSEKSRIRWLCRRGMKELDVLFERFLAYDYDQLTREEHDEFVALLNHEDPDLWVLILGHAEPDNELQGKIIERICQFQRPPGT